MPTPTSPTNGHADRLGDDILTGTQAIADYAFDGDRRRVEYLIRKRRIPIFKFAGGGIVHARKSTLLAHIEQLERERQEPAQK